MNHQSAQQYVYLLVLYRPSRRWSGESMRMVTTVPIGSTKRPHLSVLIVGFAKGLTGITPAVNVQLWAVCSGGPQTTESLCWSLNSSLSRSSRCWARVSSRGGGSSFWGCDLALGTETCGLPSRQHWQCVQLWGTLRSHKLNSVHLV